MYQKFLKYTLKNLIQRGSSVDNKEYKVGDRVLFDYSGNTFSDEKNIWSAFISNIKKEYYGSTYTIEFDGVIHPKDDLGIGPQDSFTMNIISTNDLRPREYNPEVDDVKTSEWKKQVEQNKSIVEQREIDRVNGLRASFSIGQHVSYKKYISFQRDNIIEDCSGEIKSIESERPFMTVQNDKGGKDRVNFERMICYDY
jgi:hypothetical protein